MKIPHYEQKFTECSRQIEYLVTGGEGGNGVTDVSIFGSIQRCLYT